MSEKLDYGRSEEDQETPWDDLTNAIIRTKQEWKEAALEKAIRHYAEIYDIEMDFAKRNENLALSNGQMSQKEFERWEDAVSDELKLGEEEIQRGEMKLSKKAEAMQNMIAYRVDKELPKTIEAQAGRFYVERDNELRLAIRKTGGPDADEDLTYLNGFYPMVAAHLDYKYMSADEIQDYGVNAYERQRTRVHNDTIRHLNGLNRLSKKYGTRPFTPRDFWTSDLCDKTAQTPAIAAIMRYDRDIVEEYYAIAFKKDVHMREGKAAQRQRYNSYP